MSVEAITWALRQPVRPSSTKFVLVVLANCASGDTFLAYPSTQYLADATGQDRKTVVLSLAKLRDAGLIEDTGKRAGTTRQVVVYRLRCANLDLFPEATQNRTRSKDGPGPEEAGNRSVFPAEQALKRTTEPKGNVKEPSKKRAAAEPLPPVPEWVPEQPWADFVEARRKMRAPLTHRAAELVLITLDQLKAQGHDPAAVLNQSTKNGWRDVFPLKVPGTGYASDQRRPSGELSGKLPDAKDVLAPSRPTNLPSEAERAARLAQVQKELRR